MMKILTENLKKQIKKHSELDETIECCGFVIFSNSEKELINYPCQNTSVNPSQSFKIDPVEYIEAKQIGQILAIYHSHPDTEGNLLEFSELDKKTSENLNLPNILYLLKTEEFLTYVSCGYENPYVGRPYCLGVFDCFTLVQDYFKRELNVDISDVNHSLRMIDNFNLLKFMPAQTIKDFIINHCIQNGGIEVDKNNIKKHDVIIVTADNTEFPLHNMIYLGNNLVLHQPRGDSLMENYDDRLRKKTVFVFRHKSLM